MDADSAFWLGNHKIYIYMYCYLYILLVLTYFIINMLHYITSVILYIINI